MASAEILEPFHQNKEIFDTEMEDLDEGAQDGELSSWNENLKSPAKEETPFIKDDIFDDESSLQSSLDSGENDKEAVVVDSELSRSVVEESILNTSSTKSVAEPSVNNDDIFDDEKSLQNSCSSDNDDENETDKRISSQRQRSPKPRRLKKAAIQSIHSECQKMLRESVIKLPYHQPAAKSITDFLKRVPIVKPKDDKQSQHKDIKNSSSAPGSDMILNSQLPSATTDGKAATPKLSTANDPFFLDETPTEKRPVKGVQSLMQRFAKHTTKPQAKSTVASKTKEAVINEDEKQSTEKPPSIIVKEKIEKAMPGERLNILKQQLENKMKVQRAELRKIHESQRRLDNEEISGEEEEEEEEMTDEESDSDYEIDKWNEEDEKKQEDDEDDDSVERKNDLIDDEADEDDDSNSGFEDMTSGSDGDVSDEGNSDDDDDDKNSVFSDDEKMKLKKHHKVKKQKKSKQQIHDERTLDLFNVNSNSQTDIETCNTAGKDAESTNDDNTGPELCLRLDSIEEDEEVSQNFTKTKEFKSLTTAMQPSTTEEPSQSSLGFQMAFDPEGTNESSRIQPAQGGGSNRPASSDSENNELMSMFPKISKHINRNQKNTETQSNKKAGKLSQLTLPIEDSQDLFYDESTEDNDEEKAQQQVTVTNNFSFTLDEDTQFTQMLDTQGFLFSTSKQKSKSKDLLEGSEKDGTQGMEEILGLCSGKFSGLESMPKKQSKKPHSFFGDKKDDKNKSPNMDELLGLCSGQFVSDKATDETTRKLKPRSLLGTAIREDVSKSPPIDELLDLCSGVFPNSVKVDTQNKTNLNTSKELNTKDRGEEEEGKEESNSNDKKEEEEEDAKVEMENEENSDDEHNDNSEKDVDEGEDSDVDIDEMRKKKKYQKSYGKIFNKNKFYEEEAELSGSDIGSDEDLDIDTDEDVLEEDSDQEELPSDEELQKQINKVHMKSILDQDKAELRLVQDMYLPDGDLHGQGRKRNFRWRGIDSNSQMDLFDNKLWNEDDHIDGNMELLTEEECKRRKERYERDTFLREEMSKNKQDSFVDIDENSQVILNFIKDTSNASPALVKPDENPKQTKPKPVVPAPRLQRIPSQKGSFLNRSKATLSRLSSITANTPNAASSGRTFVFKTVESADKTKSENSKKMPRTTSLIEPSAKRPKLDRSLSDTPNSIFAML